MALTAYCKKCGREVDPGEICPYCGTKLGRTAAHTVWCIERQPVKDWMCWNAVMRLLLPAALAVLLLVLLLEGLSGGTEALERLFAGSFPLTLLILLAGAVVLVFLILLLQGRDLMDFAVDNRGIHVTRYLPEPTALKLIMRLKAPSLLNRTEENGRTKVLKLEERSIAWKEVARVQLWPEKCTVLFYAPSWWLRLAAQCTPFTWDDTLGFIREKLGKKKAVRLPRTLRAQAERTAGRARPAAQSVPEVEEAVEQIMMEEALNPGDAGDGARDV